MFRKIVEAYIQGGALWRKEQGWERVRKAVGGQAGLGSIVCHLAGRGCNSLAVSFFLVADRTFFGLFLLLGDH